MAMMSRRPKFDYDVIGLDQYIDRDKPEKKPRNKIIMKEEKEEKKKQSVGSAIVSLIVIGGCVYALGLSQGWW